MQKTDYVIIGAGLAGCECALTLARFGLSSTLYEQKPQFRSEAHISDNLAELVCSNSLRSNDRLSGVGLLKKEMRSLQSAFMTAADNCAVPAGKALAVDREKFSDFLTARIIAEPKIQLSQRRIDSLADPILSASASRGIIITAGPLASSGLAESLASILGAEHCYFYDAIAPIVWTHSLDKNIVFRASRYGQTEETPIGDARGDYLNCPLNREEYEAFHAALCSGETFKAKIGEQETHFEGCMPIEALAQRGLRTLAFGPMKPVGLIDPRTGKRPWAVLQLRPEKANMETCNLVGCQTKLLQREQERIFRLVPGLQDAEFARYGSMHRNTYINAPVALTSSLAFKSRPEVYLAGQLTGVEGYVESAASGLWLALLLAYRAHGVDLPPPPEETALGALLAHLRRPCKNFQPSNIHFGLMPELPGKVKKKDRKEAYATRAETTFAEWLAATGLRN